MADRHLVVGMTGATGMPYALRLLEALATTDVTTHLVISRAARMTMAYETDLTVADVKQLADHTHPLADVGAAIASGSFPTIGMVIVPCSMRTLAEVATGASSTLLTRAADVTLKERRRLVLLTRESPLHLVHIENMRTVTRMGGIVCPTSPAFYTRPRSIEDLVDHGVGRVLDLFDIDNDLAPRWTGSPPPHQPPNQEAR